MALLDAGCTLVSPGCRNREVKAGIEKDARDSIDLWLTTTSQQTLPEETPLRLVQPVETSRNDTTTRACSAKIAVGSGDKLVAVPVDYEVIAGEDGQAFYRWNKEEFGRTFIGTSLLSILPEVAGQPATGDRPSNGGAKHRSRGAKVKPAHSSIDDEGKSDEQWHDAVVALINAQAINFRIEGSGSVTVGFEVSGSGTLSNIKVLQSSGNAGLDKTAMQMVARTGRVRPPPGQQTSKFSMKIAFL